jgi:hypothetical protein
LTEQEVLKAEAGDVLEEDIVLTYNKENNEVIQYLNSVIT